MLKTLQYNIYSTPLDNLFVSRERETFKRIRRVSTLIKKIKNIDIITLNETHGKKTTKQLLAMLKKQGFKYNTNIVGEKKILSTCRKCKRAHKKFLSLGITNGGVIIISKHPIVYEQDYIFKHCRNFFHRPSTATADCLAHKGCVFAKIKKGKTFINVIATHLQAWPGKTFDKVRLKQLKEIRVFAKQLKKNGIIKKKEPLIYQGDFNIDYYKYKSTLLKMCHLLRTNIPKLIGENIFSSDPTSNYLVETSGWVGPERFSKALLRWKRTFKKKLSSMLLRRKTRKKCKKFVSFADIIQRLSKKKGRYNKYSKNFESGLKEISKNNKLTRKCHNTYAKSELLDYILYDIDNRKPITSTVTIIDPKKVLNTKKEISDHYPILGRFKFG